jgi:prepilin-type N-terminal cleavage/methylation domain-containing protein
MRMHARPSRPAFTLLEVLLALAIGLLLLGALYAALNVQIRHSRAGRDVVERSTLARALFTRMTNDISGCMTPGGPLNYAPATSSPGGGGGAGGGSGSGANGNPSAGAAAASTTSYVSGSSTATTTNGLVPFGAGVQGTTNQLMLWVSRVPPSYSPAAIDANTAQPIVPDVRKVVYWLAGSGPGGLARQEIAMVTSSDPSVVWPPQDETPHIVAEEVKNLTFSYFDGQNWNDTWDGSTFGADGVTPIGPPMAVAITMDIAVQNSNAPTGAQQQVKTYRHVVSIPTAGSLPLQQLQQTGTTASGGSTP